VPALRRPFDSVEAAAFGEHSTVAKKAQRIHESFILEQSMSD
jgi:hypothetical protein